MQTTLLVWKEPRTSACWWLWIKSQDNGDGGGDNDNDNDDDGFGMRWNSPWVATALPTWHHATR